MRVGFAGTPVFAAAALSALLDAGHRVPLVLTQPDRPRGRGLKLTESPVKALARRRGLVIQQPPTLKTAEAQASAVAVPLDVLVVAAYGLILPPAILAWPRRGCLNIHASLLPRWRGAAPIQRALLAGDRDSGITIMQMDAGLDTGPMLDVLRVPIAARETAGTLELRLAEAGARAIVSTLSRLSREDAPVAQPQPPDGVTYAAKVRRDDAAIDWSASAEAIDRQIRAFDPAPGAFTEICGEAVKIWRAEPVALAHSVPVGTVLITDVAALVVACGTGALRIAELQPAGGKRMPAAAFVAGRQRLAGARFEMPVA
jgi:methionyl-tRNA formyltransferase